MKRREFLTGTFLGLFIKPQSDYSSPKFKIGDYVEYRFKEYPESYERGNIVGILAPECGHSSYGEWLYYYEIKESDHEPCIGATGEAFESSLSLIY